MSSRDHTVVELGNMPVHVFFGEAGRIDAAAMYYSGKLSLIELTPGIITAIRRELKRLKRK